MIKVMVAEDDIHQNNVCCNFLTNDKDINVISRTTDGKKTLEEYLRLKPDILLLDLDLPTMNGLEIINALCKNTEEKNKCNIIVVSASESYRSQLYNTSKVYRIIPKPMNLEYILTTIKEIPHLKPSISSQRLRELLLALKFNLYSESTNYFIEAVKVSYEKPYLLRNMQDLYTEISQKNNTNFQKVQWGIRSSVRTMNKYANTKVIQSVFPWYDTSRNLSPRYLLTLFIEYFKFEN